MASVAVNSPTTGTRPYQVVVWGATGFTGRLVAEHIARSYQGKIRWAIAGRSQQKLEEIREKLVRVNGDCKDVPILVADAYDSASLAEMLQQTKVVVSTAGPFALLGNNLVEQSVACGTHYCDITGEVQWVRRNMLKYHKEAAEKNVKIVHCCGFDSIPSDLGTLMMVDHIKKTYGKKTSQVYNLMVDGKGGFSGGTCASIMNLAASEMDEAMKICSDAYYLANVHNKSGGDKPSPFSATYIPPAAAWSAPFLMEPCNGRIVQLSNALASEPYGTDFKYMEMTQTGGGMGGRIAANLVAGIMGFLAFIVRTPPLRALLQKMLPKQGDGPSENSMLTGSWKMALYALTEEPMGVEPTIVKGTTAHMFDPGYMSTSRMLLETGLALALDEDTIAASGAQKGGVLTASTAVGMPLIDRLRKAGFTFEVKETKA